MTSGGYNILAAPKLQSDRSDLRRDQRYETQKEQSVLQQMLLR